MILYLKRNFPRIFPRIKFFKLVLVLAIILFVCLYFWLFDADKRLEEYSRFGVTRQIDSTRRAPRSEAYTDECLRLYKKLRHPNQSLIFQPPLRQPPAEMLNDFEQNGYMPIMRYIYCNDVYADSGLVDEKSKQIPVITKQQVDEYRTRSRKNETMSYGDLMLNTKALEYKDYIRDKSVVVIGTQSPWVEAIASEAGASRVTTVDYTRKRYEEDGFEWVHVYDFFDRALETKELENFDIAMSYSSIEHTGLGRYGDALDPYGDVHAVRQVHCMLKPGGLFFLGLPSSHDGFSFIEFNANRVYGLQRLDLLFKDWTLLESVQSNDYFHTIHILRK